MTVRKCYYGVPGLVKDIDGEGAERNFVVSYDIYRNKSESWIQYWRVTETTPYGVARPGQYHNCLSGLNK